MNKILSKYYFIIFFTLSFVIFNSLSTNMQKVKNIKILEPENTLMLYQTMKDVHEILGKYNIEYYADGGTLLGAIRHKGIIPWDDDLDISIKKEFEKN